MISNRDVDLNNQHLLGLEVEGMWKALLERSVAIDKEMDEISIFQE